MAFPRTEKNLYEKDRVDLAIDDFAKIEKPKKSDLNRVKVMAQIEQGIDKYRARSLQNEY